MITTEHHQDAPRTIAELCDRYETWAASYYQKPTLDGGRRPTRQDQQIHYALRPLRAIAGELPPAKMAAEVLYEAQQWMIEAGHCRRTVNDRCKCIRTMFKWAARPPRRWLPATVVHDLSLVEPVKKGRTSAPDHPPIKPVDPDIFEATLPYLSSVVRTMAQVQLLAGMRPGEVTIMRPCDIDRSDATWIYRPAEHKVQHHDIDRVVYLGPQARELLKPLLLRKAATEFLFSPEDAMAEVRARRTNERRTPLSCGNKPGTNLKKRPTKQPGARYDTQAYGQAVRYACERAFPPPEHLQKIMRRNRGRQHHRHYRVETPTEWRRRLAPEKWEQLKAWRKAHRWTPNQLRHSAATRLRRQYGLDVARAVLGHTSTAMTEVYAEVDMDKATAALQEIG